MPAVTGSLASGVAHSVRLSKIFHQYDPASECTNFHLPGEGGGCMSHWRGCMLLAEGTAQAHGGTESWGHTCDDDERVTLGTSERWGRVSLSLTMAPDDLVTSLSFASDCQRVCERVWEHACSNSEIQFPNGTHFRKRNSERAGFPKEPFPYEPNFRIRPRSGT